MNAAAEPAPSRQREWWLRTLAIFQSPTAVFTALRDDSNEAVQARQEPILAIIFLAGIAGVLSTTIAGRIFDDPTFDGLELAVWAFLGGAIYGLIVYWLGGVFLFSAGRLLGSNGSYRRARHVLAYAAAPLVLLLLFVWPVRLAVYGDDLFRSGGDDSGAGDTVFEVLALAFGAWSVALLVIGTRAVHGWSAARAVATVVLAAGLAALFVAVLLGLQAIR
jgi:hypothetical protein